MGEDVNGRGGEINENKKEHMEKKIKRRNDKRDKPNLKSAIFPIIHRLPSDWTRGAVHGGDGLRGMREKNGKGNE